MKVKKGKFIRLHNDVHERVLEIKTAMERDVFIYTGKKKTIPMNNVIRAITDPNINETRSIIPINKLSQLGRYNRKRRIWIKKDNLIIH